MPVTNPPTEAAIFAALDSVIDPEVGINIVDLGLIYRVTANEDVIHVVMTMTSPACPMSEIVLDDVREALAPLLAPACRLDVELVFDPPWDASRMSAAARARLGV